MYRVMKLMRFPNPTIMSRIARSANRMYPLCAPSRAMSVCTPEHGRDWSTPLLKEMNMSFETVYYDAKQDTFPLIAIKTPPIPKVEEVFQKRKEFQADQTWMNKAVETLKCICSPRYARNELVGAVVPPLLHKSKSVYLSRNVTSKLHMRGDENVVAKSDWRN